MPFNPENHIIMLPSRGGSTKYLEVPYRVQWFRDEHPGGRIMNELVDIKNGLYIVRATVYDGAGNMLSSCYGTAREGSNKNWSGRELEKAETAAIGRALAIAGYGTQFTGSDLDDSDNLSDTPIRTQPQRQSEPRTRPAPPPAKPAAKPAPELVPLEQDLDDEPEAEAPSAPRPAGDSGGVWFAKPGAATEVKQATGKLPHEIAKATGKKITDFATFDDMVNAWNAHAEAEQS